MVDACNRQQTDIVYVNTLSATIITIDGIHQSACFLLFVTVFLRSTTNRLHTCSSLTLHWNWRRLKDNESALKTKTIEIKGAWKTTAVRTSVGGIVVSPPDCDNTYSRTSHLGRGLRFIFLSRARKRPLTFESYRGFR